MLPIDVLLVDDDPDYLNLIGALLRGIDIEVLCVKDGMEALKKLDFVHPKLIIVDVQMPGINGFQLCQHLRKQEEWKDIPFFFCSTFGNLAYQVQGLNLGADLYITKPVKADLLLRKIRECLDANQKMEILKKHYLPKLKSFQGTLTDLPPRYLFQLLQSKEANKYTKVEVRFLNELGEEYLVYLDEKRLIHAEKENRKGLNVFYECLGLKKGNFQVRSCKRLPNQTIEGGLSFHLHQGFASLNEFNLLFERFSQEGTLLKLKQHRFPSSFGDEALSVLELIPLYSSLSEVLAESSLTPLKTMKILLKLKELGYLEVCARVA